MEFNPDATGVANGAYFGFTFSHASSALSLLSVPFDATVSYRDGSSCAPTAIIDASTQVEIYDAHFPDAWRRGIFTLPPDVRIEELNAVARAAATVVIDHIESGGHQTDEAIAEPLKIVNDASLWVNQNIYETAKFELDEGKIVGLVGGDHSTPLGLIRALGERNEGLGILHIDAHMDLRDGYEGFTYSHASIMRRALECTGVGSLVQVGVRDFSQTEAEFARGESRITQFADADLFAAKADGRTWSQICAEIIAVLPQKVYISFDIDGLDRAFCPSTGTPVPGGLSYNEAVYLLITLARSGRQIVGFDLNEVAPSSDQNDEWDAIVGARMLYKLCNLTLSNNNPNP